MKKILVIAPHPDDETIGCGGTLLRHKSKGDLISCILTTKLKPNKVWNKETVFKKEKEIEKVKKIYKFKFFERLDFLPRELDNLPLSLIISKISNLLDKIKPEIIYIPYIYDVHTDHQIISKAAISSTKWFRSNYIKKIYMYETLSETNFNFSQEFSFQPNVFIDISKFLKKKLEIFRCYKTEFKKHPFPRSEEAIKALATLRGSQSGFKAAESFKLIFNKK
jgi:LmbE family N-acetylglucosaminyl deacetylase|tara:strand:+ start:674 stop:1339 length:666 start_codon:yes stop_codon:yes gene_type:complete